MKLSVYAKQKQYLRQSKSLQNLAKLNKIFAREFSLIIAN
jgi:hypothetical protein